MSDLLLRGARPWGFDTPADVLVHAGAIERIEPGIGPGDAEVLDVAGRLVLPGLVDAHCHLDKTLYGGPWVSHSAGDALEYRIANDRRRRGEHATCLRIRRSGTFRVLARARRTATTWRPRAAASAAADSAHEDGATSPR